MTKKKIKNDKSTTIPVQQFLQTDENERIATNEVTISELRSHISRLERKNYALRSKEGLIIEAVESTLSNLPINVRAPKPPKITSKQKSEEVAILHLSDIQLGKITKSYNSVVADDRVQLAIQKTIMITEMRRAAAKIDTLNIYLGGDMVEGEDIFPGQSFVIDSSLLEQACINGPTIFSKAILTALENFTNVNVIAVYGNHGRNGPKNVAAHPKTNWDRVFYHTLKAVLLGNEANPRSGMERLKFNIADEFWAIDRVFDWGNLIVHGHQITGGFAGFPFYGTAKKAWGWIDAIEDPWDNLFFGHFHTPAMLTLGHRRVYANGTTESDNDYAKEQLAACGIPAQRLCFMSEQHGVISDNLLELETRKPSATRNRYGTANR